HIVNACGYRVNEVGAMMNVEYPVVSMEHMCFLTEPIEALTTRQDRVPMVRCPRDTFYMRQEKDGLLVGVYEQDCKTFGMNGIDPDFANALCPDDLDRCLPKLEAIFERVPCLGNVGIRSVVNGPITYAADAGPLVGKLPNVRNAWSMNGLRVGIGEGGGYGKMLAQMMVHGETEWDTWQLDPRRITDFATLEYTAAKAIEDYQNEFRWHMPHEHRPAGRPAKTTPLYPAFKERNAAFGVVNGWERVSFFRPRPDFEETHTYRFPNWHAIVADEVRSVCEGVGITEISGFNRYRITGEGARDWLDSLTCSRVPREPGKVGLCYFLTDNGNVLGEATLALLDNDHIWYGSAAAAEYHDMDWLRERLPPGGNIEIRSLTNTHTTLVLAGPKSRDVLQAAAPALDASKDIFPWMSARRCKIGGADAVVLSVSYSGELAFELHVANEALRQTYETLVNAGVPCGLSHFGMYAVESMRLEKGYGHWKTDLITEFNPFEAGLQSFVDMSKNFPGKTGLERQIGEGARKKRALLTIDCDFAPAQPGETVFLGDKPVGTITSAGWGFRTGRNIAIAYLAPDHAATGTKLDVFLLGRRVQAEVSGTCLLDPANTRQRS
ncbi:MAG: glycine cleavage T C-terminal barrel domain-containing protein, partial [Hyphomicrobiaceae bacterium]